MPDVVIIPSSGTINFLSSLPFSTPFSQIQGSGQDLNVTNSYGNINISGSLFINNNRVSYSGHTHNTSDINNFNSAVSGLIPIHVLNSGSGINISTSGTTRTISIGNHTHSTSDITNFSSVVSGLLPSTIVYTTGYQTISNAKLFSSGLYIGQAPLSQVGRLLHITTSDSSATSSSLKIVSSGSQIPIIDFRNDGNIAIGNIPGMGFSHRLNIRGSTSDSTLASLNITNSNNNTILFARNDRRVGIGTNSPSGQLHVIGSGIFTSGIFINQIPVSISGHTHSTSDITNFNSGVSGLIPIKQISAGAGISVSNSSGNYTISSVVGTGTNEDNLLTKNPHGFVNINNSIISFNRLSKTFSIAPSGSDYDIYIKGNKITRSGTNSIVLSAGNGPYYIYINSENILSYDTSVFDYSNQVPVSFIYFNNGADTPLFTDERHPAGIDSNTIQYINSNIGLSHVNGLSLTNYTTEGNGDLLSDATIGIENGTILDYDKTINISHSDTPTNNYEQRLSPIARIPVFYKSSNRWTTNKDYIGEIDFPGSNLPYKNAGLGPQYNIKNIDSDTWSVANAPVNTFVCYWICVTSSTVRPIISIMGQRYDSSLDNAKSFNIWKNLNLDGIPLNSIKPIHRLIYQVNSSYTNNVGGRLVDAIDLRYINHNFSKNDHSSLYNLNSNDDHSQYVHISNKRAITATHEFTNGIICDQILPIDIVNQNISIGSQATNIKLLDNDINITSYKDLIFNYNGDYDYGHVYFRESSSNTDIMSITIDPNNPSDGSLSQVNINRLNVTSTANIQNILTTDGDNQIIIKSPTGGYILDTNAEEDTATLNNTDIGGPLGCRINNTIIGQYVPSTGYFTELKVTGIDVSLSGHLHSVSDIINFFEEIQDDLGNNFIVDGTGVQTVYNDNSGILTFNNLHTEINELSLEPQGFVNRLDSIISFNDSTRTFTIQPTGSSYDVYIQGVKVTKTGIETVVIPTGTALNYIHFDTSNAQLQTKSTFFDFSTDVPIAFIHWNSDINQSTFFGEERHGIRMDSMTHKWIHNTFGMQYIDGLSIGGYTLLGDGSSNSHAQISIGNGTLYQEDIIIDIADGNDGIEFTQQLDPIAYIPVYYHSGVTGQWVRSSGTPYPVKYDATRAQYNLYSGGTWTVPNVSNNKYFAMWIVATNDINDPILAILGQTEDSNLGSAENNNNWTDLDLTNIPTNEIRPLYRLIFTTNSGYTNTPKSSLQSILDLRKSVLTTTYGVPQNDHGNLFGLGDDDHSQYVHINNSRTISANHTFTNGLTINSGLLSATSGNFSLLTINNTRVSVSGHTHSSSDITNFNTAVSGLFPLGIVYTTGTQTITGNKTFSGSTTTVFTTGAKVGIGTDSPSYLLDIYDYDTFSPFRASDSNNNYIAIGPPEDGTNVVKINASDKIYLTTNAGDISITGTVSINGQTLQNAALGSATNGQLLIGNGSSFSKSTLTAGTGISISNGSGTITINTSGLQTTLTNPVTGTGVANHIPYWSSTSGLLADSSQLVWDSTNNRLGIGTASPSGSLDVNGTLYVGTTGVANNLYIRTGQAGISETALRIRTDTSSNLYLDAANASVKVGNQSADVDIRAGNSNVTIGNSFGGTLANQFIRFMPANTERMRLDGNGNLGIGTTNPSERIHISGQQPTIRLNNTLTYDTQLRLTDTVSDWSVGINQGNAVGSGFFNIRSVTAGANRLTIDTSGNIGINSISPVQRLHVSGDINIEGSNGLRINNSATAGQYLRGDGTRFVSSSIQAGDVPTLNQNTTGSAATLATSRTLWGQSFNGSVNVTGNMSNVGKIEQSWADQRVGIFFNNDFRNGMAVFANTRLTNIFCTTNDGIGGAITFSTRNGSGVSDTDYGSERMRITNSGRVGIGTTTPTSQLHVIGTGNFTQALQVNGTGVSVSGHLHTSSDISNFDSAVSGLLPTITNSGDNRVLTSTGSSLGINAESNLTFDGQNLSAPYLLATYASGDEGGEIQLAKPPSGTLSGGVTIDAYQNKIRFFEQGGTARGFYLDLSSGGAAASTNLAGGGSATTVSNYGDNRLITSDGTSTGLNAESNFTFNGSLLTVTGSGLISSGLFLNDQTASTIASFDNNKKIISLSTVTYPSLAELSYVKGVTSAIQTQLNNKQATLTNPVTGTGTTNYISKWTNSSGLVNSSIVDDGSQTVRFGFNQYLYMSDDWYGGEIGFLLSDQSVLAVKNSDGSFGYGGGTPGAESLVVTSAGDVGIGTNSPTAKLDVNGEIKCLGLDSYGTTWIGSSDGSVGMGVNDNPSGTFGSTAAFAAFQGFNVGVTSYNPLCITAGYSPQLYLNTNGNVGVNTATPSATLHVNGSGLISDSLYFADSTRSIKANGNNLDINTSDSINFKISGSSALIVDGDGNDVYVVNNLGIGTTSPLTKVQVVGSVSVAADGSDVSNGNEGIIFGTDGSINCNDSNPGPIFSVDATNGLRIYGDGGTGSAVILSTDRGFARIGIGTTTPDATLHVAGDAHIEGSLQSAGPMLYLWSNFK